MLRYVVTAPCRVGDVLDAGPRDVLRVFGGEHLADLRAAWALEQQHADLGQVLVRQLDGDEPDDVGLIVMVSPTRPITLSSRAKGITISEHPKKAIEGASTS